MRRDAEIVSKLANTDIYYFPPAGSNPQLIFDVGCDQNGSSLDAYAKTFRDSRIVSVEFDLPKISALRERLAYHDNISYIFAESYDLDDVFDNYGFDGRVIDFMKVFVPYKEKIIFSNYPSWPKFTRFLVSRISANYDYNSAKVDLRKLGFRSSAFYNNMAYFVMGENHNV